LCTLHIPRTALNLLFMPQTLNFLNFCRSLRSRLILNHNLTEKHTQNTSTVNTFIDFLHPPFINTDKWKCSSKRNHINTDLYNLSAIWQRLTVVCISVLQSEDICEIAYSLRYSLSVKVTSKLQCKQRF